MSAAAWYASRTSVLVVFCAPNPNISHYFPELASGLINRADRLVVELYRPIDAPPFILLQWPEDEGQRPRCRPQGPRGRRPRCGTRPGRSSDKAGTPAPTACR